MLSWADLFLVVVWFVELINLFLTKRIGGKPVHLPVPVACWISPAVMLTNSTWPLWSWAPSANSGTKDSNMFPWSLREQVKNYSQHIYKSCRNLVFVFQLLAAFLSPRKLLSKTAKFSLVFFILQQNKRSKPGKKSPKALGPRGKIGDERLLIKFLKRSIFSNMAKRD